MASNIDKVEEKAAKDLEEAIKTSKTPAEMEKKLDPQDVSYKIVLARLWQSSKLICNSFVYLAC